jgi:predicted small secreted protein
MKPMYRKTISLAWLIVICSIFLTGCPMGDGGVSVGGRVLSESGKPIKGAKVILISKGAKDEDESREDGSYAVGVIHAPIKPNGTLTVSKEGYETYQQQFSSREEIGHQRDILLKALGSSKVESK